MGTAGLILALWCVLAVVFAAVHYRWVHYEAPRGRPWTRSLPGVIRDAFAAPRFAPGLATSRIAAAMHPAGAAVLLAPDAARLPDSRERTELLSYFMSFDRN